MPYRSGVKAHDDTVLAAEGARQVAVAGATQANVTSAEITFYRTCYKSALNNNVSPSVFTQALFALGVRS
jgi:hypothetical protein